MNRIYIYLTAFMMFVACSTVPVTGRKQLKLLPESTLLSMSFSSYNTFLKENEVATGTEDAAMVKRVGNNIADAVREYLGKRNNLDRIENYKWEFNLVKDESINAWAMPGGKTVVYTGLLPVAQNENGLAVVMGHEIAHAVARHGNERMSQMLTAQLGGMALDVALQNRSQETRQIFYTAYGLGATVGVILPFSRKHEAEADEMGLIFMALAGYDPREAIPFWQRMAKASEGAQQPPEFLSTHPSHEDRIARLKKLMPNAVKIYEANK